MSSMTHFAHPPAVRRGVNLGNWLVLERWMHRALFADHPGCGDEYTLSAALGDRAEAVLRRHREAWITEDDFAWLAARGVNSVRIPFGYWILEPDGPFVGSAGLLDFAVDACERHGIAAVLDLHGLPGSQGPEHHTGRAHHFRWPADRDCYRRSLDIVEQVAQRYAGRPGVIGLSVVNEPEPTIERGVLVEFYRAAVERVRHHMSAEEAAVVIAAYPENLLDTYHGCLCETPGVWTDVHLYQSFVPWEGTDELDYVRRAMNRQAKIQSAMASGPVIVGEWSLSFPKELKGSLMAMEPGRRDAIIRAYADVQLACYEQTTGWYFWSYKVDDDPLWSFRLAVERGYLPWRFTGSAQVWSESASAACPAASAAPQG